MLVSLLYIRLSTHLTILRLWKLDLELSFITATLFLPSTIDFRVLTPRSINYIIKVMCSYCDTLAIANISYRYELISSQLLTPRFMSPRARECALSYTHRVHNGLTIVANNRSLNLTMLYCRQIYCTVQLSCFAIYWMETIPHHSEHMNPKVYLPRPRRCGRNRG